MLAGVSCILLFYGAPAAVPFDRLARISFTTADTCGIVALGVGTTKASEAVEASSLISTGSAVVMSRVSQFRAVLSGDTRTSRSGNSSALGDDLRS
jgi:hypothetical protein